MAVNIAKEVAALERMDDAREFNRQARELGWFPKIVILGGEPTLHRDLFSFIDKADGCMVLPQADFFLAPTDFGVINHRPCHNHAAIGCGISVDAGGYAICSIGGAIDSVLDLKVRTKELKDLFDKKFAHQQTCALCDVCGRELGITSHHIAKSQVMHGTLMSPTWQKAVKRIEHRGRRQEESA